MKKHKIAVAVVCVGLFTGAWAGAALGESFTAEVPPIGEPWGAGRVFKLLGPTHGGVSEFVTRTTGLTAGDYTQIYLAGFPEDPVVPVEGPISIYTFDPDPTNPPNSCDPVDGDVFHLIVTGPLTPGLEPLFPLSPKAQLTSPDPESVFNFDNALLGEGLRWVPVITPAGDLDLFVVPEPAALVLLMTGCGPLLWIAWRRKAADSP